MLGGDGPPRDHDRAPEAELAVARRQGQRSKPPATRALYPATTVGEPSLWCWSVMVALPLQVRRRSGGGGLRRSPPNLANPPSRQPNLPPLLLTPPSAALVVLVVGHGGPGSGPRCGSAFSPAASPGAARRQPPLARVMATTHDDDDDGMRCAGDLCSASSARRRHLQRLPVRWRELGGRRGGAVGTVR
jgi:hypothetical protein